VPSALGVLACCDADETGLAIVPSVRVSAREFALILAANGVSVRPLGQGSAQVCDSQGRRARVGGVVIIAARSSEVRKLKTHARLCGVTVIPVRVESP